jgi:hypothetical protein
MDLVRLGLERGRTAEDAVDIITALLTAHGQGGSGYADKEWPYHNSFLVADRRAAFVLETSDRHWAVRHVADVASVSNHVSIADDWDALSDGRSARHRRRLWPAEADRRFDFAAASRHRWFRGRVGRPAPAHVRPFRRGRADCASTPSRRAARPLRPGRPATDLTPGSPQYFSVCMRRSGRHDDMSMIARRGGDG